jgi:hypothetical protein
MSRDRCVRCLTVVKLQVFRPGVLSFFVNIRKMTRASFIEIRSVNVLVSEQGPSNTSTGTNE